MVDTVANDILSALPHGLSDGSTTNARVGRALSANASWSNLLCKLRYALFLPVL